MMMIILCLGIETQKEDWPAEQVRKQDDVRVCACGVDAKVSK